MQLEICLSIFLSRTASGEPPLAYLCIAALPAKICSSRLQWPRCLFFFFLFVHWWRSLLCNRPFSLQAAQPVSLSCLFDLPLPLICPHVCHILGAGRHPDNLNLLWCSMQPRVPNTPPARPTLGSCWRKNMQQLMPCDEQLSTGHIVQAHAVAGKACWDAVQACQANSEQAAHRPRKTGSLTSVPGDDKPCTAHLGLGHASYMRWHSRVLLVGLDSSDSALLYSDPCLATSRVQQSPGAQASSRSGPQGPNGKKAGGWAWGRLTAKGTTSTRRKVCSSVPSKAPVPAPAAQSPKALPAVRGTPLGDADSETMPAGA